MFASSCAHSSPLLTRKTALVSIRHTIHSPEKPATGHLILAHGFLRSPDTMRHLAESFAKDGIETACITLRRSKPWAGNHVENARDMIALRKALGWDKVIYAGFSAGGLSVLLAAAEDPACVKLLLLDPVDHGNLGATAAPKVRIPALALLGQPGPGNAHRNATPMLDAIPRCRTIELAEATHCDFEARPSPLCYTFTGSKADPNRIPEIHASIIRHSTAFLTNYPATP
jgi:pimeloyl-ACP methyl ester carboxylesterase